MRRGGQTWGGDTGVTEAAWGAAVGHGSRGDIRGGLGDGARPGRHSAPSHGYTVLQDGRCPNRQGTGVAGGGGGGGREEARHIPCKVIAAFTGKRGHE